MNKKTALFTVFLVVLVDLIGFGIVLPLLPFYAAKFNASPFSIGLLYSVYSLAQLVFSPLWGALSDRIGRRPIMLLSTFGASLSYILFALSSSFSVLLISRLIGGMMGGNISTAQAYIADVTSHEDRTKGMGILGAAFGIGFMAGPAIAAILIHPSVHQWIGSLGFSSQALFLDQHKYAIPGFFAAFLSFMSFCLVFFKLPETVKISDQEDVLRIKRSNPLSPQFWKNLRKQQGASSHHLLLFLFLCIFLSSFGQSSLYSAFPLFCKIKLQLTAEQVGLQFASMGLIAILIQGGVIRLLSKRIHEKKLFFIGYLLMVIGLGLIPLATSATVLYVYLGIMAVGGNLCTPTLTSMISKEADPRQLGATMGSSQGLSALGRVLGPAWGGVLFGFSLYLPFFATALVLFCGALIGLRFKRI